MIRLTKPCSSKLPPRLLRFASFDIGKKNFAFYIEDISESKLDELEKKFQPMKKKVKRIKGALRPEYASTLKELSLLGTRITEGVYDVRENKNSNDLDTETRRNLCQLLRDQSKMWEECDYFIIEQQYYSTGQRGGANVDALKIGELVYSWFVNYFIDFDNQPHITYFGSRYKTETLGMPFKIEKKKRSGEVILTRPTKYDRKKWCTEKGISIFKDREDQEVLQKLEETKRAKQKLDDICDCLCQLQAYLFKNFIEIE